MLILADDYTGAADAVVGLAQRGIAAAILLQADGRDEGLGAVALDLDTRHRPPDEAAARVVEAIRTSRPGTFLFKKIDSTLRGPIGAELRALAGSIKRPVPMLVAPAVPENGRTVIGGGVLVRGVPLEETDVWRHEHASSGHTPSRLSQRLAQAGLRTVEIHLAELRAGASSLHTRLLDLGREGVDAVLLDAETPDDMRLIATCATAFECPPLCVGAAGLTRALGHVLSPSGHAGPADRRGSDAPVLLAIGSQSRTARRQVDHLKTRPDLTAIDVTGPLGDPVVAAANALAAGRHVLLCPPRVAQSGLCRDHAATLGAAVAELAARAGALIASGGDTARACLLALGYTRIDVEGELAPGVVLGRPAARPDLTFVSKAGDFGDTVTLSTCIDRLTRYSRGTAS